MEDHKKKKKVLFILFLFILEMLYISSKINDLNSQVLSTSVCLERITTNKTKEVTETESFTPFQWFPYKAIPIFAALPRKKIVMAMGWWTTDQVKCNQRAGALVSYGTDTNLPQLDKMHEMVTQTTATCSYENTTESSILTATSRSLKTHTDDIRTNIPNLKG